MPDAARSPKLSIRIDMSTETAILGGGCFWCLEAVFQRIPGVVKVVSGYAGGDTPNPTYRAVCDGNSGHAEVIQIYFDPDLLGYDELLSVFWQCHDPTTLNRQGNDIGTQYRSTIMPLNDKQYAIAEASIAHWSKTFKSPIVTSLEPLDVFYPAEIYHQDYYNQHKNVPYCAFVIEPKLEKLKSNKILPQRDATLLYPSNR